MPCHTCACLPACLPCHTCACLPASSCASAACAARVPPLQGLDVGPASTEKIKRVLSDSKTILWNGPLGVFEFPKFAEGTNAVAKQLAELTTKGGRLVHGAAPTACLLC